jgi:hypothetical protein
MERGLNLDDLDYLDDLSSFEFGGSSVSDVAGANALLFEFADTSAGLEKRDFFFGELDLGKLDFNAFNDGSDTVNAEEMQFLGLSLHEKGDSQNANKRGRDDSDSSGPAASNKITHLEPGDPVPLPAFGQNLFVGKDLSVTREARSVEPLLRRQVEECMTMQENEEAERRCEELHQAINGRKAWITTALRQDVWKPGTLAVLSQLLLFLVELEAKLEVGEAQRLGHPSNPSDLVRLLIFHEELGCPVFLKDSVGVITLKLIASPGLMLAWPPTDFTVKAVCGDNISVDLKVKVSKPNPQCASQCITFPLISFEKGSRNKMVRLVFNCMVKVRNVRAEVAVSVHSGVSRPFVVTTSKKQWAQALGSILMEELYPADVGMVHRNVVANAMQVAYLRSTKQDMIDSSRPLSPHDFAYIFDRYLKDSEAQIVTKQQFQAMWEWFGSMLCRIRHDSLVLDLWLHGYIMGFITKEDSERLLISEPPGTFIIRFSYQDPGSFAIAYTAPEGNSVNHYLISKNDVHMACSLDVFLGEKPFFKFLLQTIPSFDVEMRWARVDKTKAFGRAFEPIERVEGYDEALNVGQNK